MDPGILTNLKNFESRNPISVPEGTKTMTVAATCKNGQDALGELCHNIFQSSEAIEFDQSLTDDGKKMRRREMLDKEFLPKFQEIIGEHLFAGLDGTKKAHAKLTDTLSCLNIDKADTVSFLQRREIREAFLNMGDYDRRRLFQEMVNAGDPGVLAIQAIEEFGSVNLYGELVEPDVIAAAKDRLLVTRNPELAESYLEARQACESLTTDLERISASVEEYVGKLDVSVELPPALDVKGENLAQLIEQHKNQDG